MLIYYALIIYEIVISIFIYSSSNGMKAKKRMIEYSFILLTLVMAIRSNEVGVDSRAYCDYFVRIGESTDYMNIINSAPVYSIYNKVLYMLLPCEQTILVFNAIIINLGFAYFIYKESDEPVFACLCYILLYVYMNSFNASRQYMACSFFLVVIIKMKEKRYIQGTVLLILAIGVHQIVVSMIPLLFLGMFKNIHTAQRRTLLYNVAICAGSVILATSFDKVMMLIGYIMPGYEKYARGDIAFFNQAASGKNIYLTLFLLPFVLAGYYVLFVECHKFKVRKLSTDELIFIEKLCTAIIATTINQCLGLFLSKNTGVARIREFYTPFYFMLIPMVLKKTVKQWKFACFLVCLVLLIVMSVQLNINYSGVVPYQVFFGGK